MPSRHVDRDPVEGLGRASAGLVRHPQALGQQQLQPVAPMAQVRALVREDVLEKPLAGEELEIGHGPSARTHPHRTAANVLSNNSPIMERVSIRGGRPRFRGRCGLAVDSVPIEPAGKQNQFVLHETAKTLCNYPTGTDGFLAGVLRGTLPRR